MYLVSPLLEYHYHTLAACSPNKCPFDVCRKEFSARKVIHWKFLWKGLSLQAQSLHRYICTHGKLFSMNIKQTFLAQTWKQCVVIAGLASVALSVYWRGLCVPPLCRPALHLRQVVLLPRFQSKIIPGPLNSEVWGTFECKACAEPLTYNRFLCIANLMKSCLIYVATVQYSFWVPSHGCIALALMAVEGSTMTVSVAMNLVCTVFQIKKNATFAAGYAAHNK